MCMGRDYRGPHGPGDGWRAITWTPSAGWASCRHKSARKHALARESFTQLELPEFSGGRARHCLDELVALGHLPFREALLEQVGVQFGGTRIHPLLQHDARERA